MSADWGEGGGAHLLKVAESVSDGTAVAWESERLADPESAATLDALEVIEAVATAHRRAAEPVPGDTSLDLTAPLPAASGTPAAAPLPAAAGPASAPSGAAGAPMPTTWGPLRILERLGKGGFGEVFRAYDPSLQREVALKLLRADRPIDAERYLDEARRLARVRHPNVLVVYGADRHDGRVGLVTDFVRGRTLEETLAQQGPFGAQEAALVGMDLCRALAAVHAAGLVHRDVKTQNVMREQGGRTVLMDFGAVGEVAASGAALAGQGAVGTPIAMAPEQLAGRTAGPATDVYGLGVLLFRLVTGRFPVEAGTLDELLEKHRLEESTHLRDLRPDLPTDFVRVVERALEARPERRFQSMGAMERALAAALGSTVEGVVADSDTGPSRPGSKAAAPAPGHWPLRRLIFGGGVAVIGLAVVIGLLLPRPHGTSGQKSEPPGLAQAHRDIEQGHFGDAEAIARGLLFQRASASPTDSLTVATGLDVLVAALVGEGRAREPEARPLAERALALREADPSQAGTPALAGSLKNLADVRYFLHDRTGARPLYERALAIDGAAPGAGTRRLADEQTRLGDLHADLGDVRGARDFYENAVKVLEQTLGPDDREVAAAHSALAKFLLQARAAPQDVLAHFERALSIREKTLGPESPELVPTLLMLDTLETSSGHAAAAGRYRARAREIQRSAAEKAHAEGGGGASGGARASRATQEAAATGAPSLRAEVTLVRIAAGGAERSLRDADAVAPGDRLDLTFRCQESVHVYVIDVGEGGKTLVLFPLASLDLKNPLAPSARQRLPGTQAGEAIHWGVTSKGGREEVLVIASRRPLADVESYLANLPKAEDLTAANYPELDIRSGGTLRGIGGLATARAASAAGRQIADILARVDAGPEPPRDVWVRKFSLETRAR